MNHRHRCAICGQETAECSAPLVRAFDGERLCQRESHIGPAPAFYCAECIEAFGLDAAQPIYSAADLAAALAALLAQRKTLR